METNIIYLSKIWNPRENNYLFNYLIETNGNMKENNYLLIILLKEIKIETNGKMIENNCLLKEIKIIDIA